MVYYKKGTIDDINIFEDDMLYRIEYKNTSEYCISIYNTDRF